MQKEAVLEKGKRVQSHGRTNKVMIHSAILRMREQFIVFGKAEKEGPPTFHRLEMGWRIRKPTES